MHVSNGNPARTTHLGQELKKIQESQRLACSRLAPDCQMAGVVISEDRCEMTAQFLDFGVPDSGIEDFVKDVQLFRLDELLILKITSVLDHCGFHHVAYTVRDSGPCFLWFHSKITSRCFQEHTST
jgi:hypothetical protein